MAKLTCLAYCQPDSHYRRELGENQSYLKKILQSPAHYKAAKAKRFFPTRNMTMGSALHCLVLEGEEEFNLRYVLKPQDISFATKDGKQFKLENSKKDILAKEDYENVLGMAKSVSSLEWFDNTCEDYRKYNELSIYWESDGIDCKARLDRVVDMGTHLAVLDLKTTDTVDPHSFSKKVIGGFNYLFQAAWYAEAAQLAYDKPAKFIFIGIEREAPWTTSIFEVSDEMLQEGFSQTSAARKILKDCLKSKKWPPAPISYNIMELPAWYTPYEEGYAPQIPQFNELF